MMKVHLDNLWKLYQEIVHNTLFFEVLHQLPHGIVLVLAAMSGLVEKHGSTVALVLAITVSLLSKFRKPQEGPKEMEPKRRERMRKKPMKKKRTAQKRDEKGRFA